MKLTRYSNSIKSGVLVLSLVSLLILSGCHVPAEENVAYLSSEPSQLSKDIIGIWVLVGTGTPGELGKHPAAGERLKFRTERHYVITQANPNTGVIIYHLGGTYTLKGDEYIEEVEYATENIARFIGRVRKFKIEVEGDTYTEIGIDNPFTEIWKRAD